MASVGGLVAKVATTSGVVGVSVGVGVGTDTGGTGGTSGTSGATGTSGTAGASTPDTGGATGTTTSASATVYTPATSKAAWNMQVDQTVYVNRRQGLGPSAWVAYTVVYVFDDKNAVLVRDPNVVVYTGPMAVGTNLRRDGETYADS